MLRETNFTFEGADEYQPIWPGFTRESVEQAPLPAVYDEALALRSEPAIADVPPGVGYLLCAAYLGLMAALAFATVAPGPSALAIVVALFFVGMFFAVPRIMLDQEGVKKDCTTLERFLAAGMMTYTGHSTGGAALVQMLIVPVTLTAGVLAMAVIIALI